MLLLPLLAGVMLSHPPDLDGERAAAIATDFVARLAHNRLPLMTDHISHAKPGTWDRDNTVWDIGLSQEDGRHWTVLVLETGEVIYAVRAHQQGYIAPRLSTEEYRARAVAALERVPHDRPASFDADAAGNEAIGARFGIVKNGRAFVNINPDYGYMVMLDPSTGEVISFTGRAAPPITHAEPAIDSDTALGQLRAYAEAHTSDDDAARLLSQRLGKFSFSLSARLGYYKVRDEPTARLVWIGGVERVDPKFKEPVPTGFGTHLGIFIDAVTGEEIKEVKW